MAPPIGKILIVNSDPNAAATISSFLVRRGVNVRAATSLTEADAQVQADPPDLVLVESVVNGRGVASWLARLKAAHPDVACFCFVSSVTGPESARLAASGACHVVARPFSLVELGELVKTRGA